MTKQHWTIKEAAEALGLSEKTIRRRIKDGTLKAEQSQGKYGIEYRITDIKDIKDALPLDKGLDIEENMTMAKALDIEGNMAIAKALDIIKALQEENERLAGQVGFLQAQVLELDNRVRLLTEPKRKQSWWQRLLWWRITPGT